MIGFDIGLSSLVSAVKFGLETILGRRSTSLEVRKKWFEEHIKPSYEQLCAIHEDYHKQFSSVLEKFNNGTGLEEAVLILKRERPNFLLKRQEVRECLIALRDYRLGKKPKPEIDTNFYDYVQNVEDYIQAASPLGRETWYSYFIDRFSELVAQERNPFDDDYAACSEGKRAPAIAKSILENAVYQRMPEAFRHLQEKYFKIRAACMSQL